MAFNVSAAGMYTNAAVNTSKSKGVQKPTWNPNKVYKYLEDMNQGFQDYKQQAVSYYSSMISRQEGDGSLTEEELKKEIQELFPDYTLTSSEPRDVTPGKFYLYIDNSQLKKMASDAGYRAKVYGLMDSELQGKNGYTLQYSDGRNVTSHLTGSVFSLAESNRQYAGPDGIPYRGSCTSDHGFSTSASHPQVRSMSFLYNHADPGKTSGAGRTSNTAGITAKRLKEKLEKKREEKRKEKQKAEKEAQLEQLYEDMRYRGTGSKYQSAEDIALEEPDMETEAEYKSLQDYIQYLRGKYDAYNQGIVSISGSYLRKCFQDKEKRSELEKLLADADDMVWHAEENIEGYQGMRIKIDKDGNMETETWGGKVAVNEGKRLRQIAAAKNPAQLRMVMGLLNGDLSDCENGLQMGMCDENEVAKVKALMQKAQQRMSELSNADSGSGSEEEEAFDSFSINMLM